MFGKKGRTHYNEKPPPILNYTTHATFSEFAMVRHVGITLTFIQCIYILNGNTHPDNVTRNYTKRQ